MRIFKIIIRILAFIFLTVLTQVGGVLYLFSLWTQRYTDNWTQSKYLKMTLRCASFLVIYTLATFLIVPMLAKPFGRVPLPMSETNHLQPLNLLTCLLNRNYVKPELRQVAFDVAVEMNHQFPGTTLNYLDANFPFIDKFPLLPHLSHHDGKKLDFAFCYRDAKTNNPTNECPSFTGYGICEEPLSDEVNSPEYCAGIGFWQYSILTNVMPQGNKKDFVFDLEKTKAMVNLIAQQTEIEKIYIEPHLKNRMQLTSGKIRYHGCHAVRHDDHLHIQIK